MTYKTQKPTVTKTHEGTVHEKETLSHPAFGKITLSRVSCRGRGQALFGSALGHSHYIAIQVRTAKLDRHLNHDWIHAGKHVTEFYMSEAQWAQFVSSVGMGEGTPITFRDRPDDGYTPMHCPGIEPVETMKETFEREIEETAKKYVQEAKDLVKELEALVAAGKAGKGQLTEIKKKLEHIATGIPNTMGFIQSQFAESMEKTVEAGKAEIEGFVGAMATRTGIEVLRNQSVQLLENDKS